MGELRDEIIGILNPAGFLGYRKFDEETADRILAIPRLRNAMALEGALLGGNVDGNLTVAQFRQIYETTKDIVAIIDPLISTNTKG